MSIPARLERPVRVRFDECGPDGAARASSFLRYAQDVAWAHSEAAGFDRAWYATQGLTWLARCVELTLRGSAATGHDLLVSTEVVGWRRVWARRQSEVREAAGGALVATVATDWVLLGPSGGPVRVPPSILAAFPVDLPDFEPARVPLEPTPPGASVTTLRVRRHELDPLDHVNNAVYLDWLEEAVADAGGTDDLERLPRRARLEYLRPARPGQRVEATAWHLREPGRTGWACRMGDEEGQELLRAEALEGEAPLR
ncbi:MAG: acyl-[acyl-carrier-protein] thioesterase [Candidatus Limnocylindrales bacterium]